MEAIPSVQKFMTHVPKSIGFDQSLEHAGNFMKQLRLRHLPVLKGGKLVGLITDRDINLVLSLKGVDPRVLTVEEACTLEPYCIPSATPLNQVLNEMSANRYGCALVVDGGKLVGIFTEVDAYKALAGILENRNRL